jgi:predicted Zn-dependent protease
VTRVIGLLAFAIAPLFGQACPQPPAMAASNELNLFTPSQELDLGDAIAEHMQRGIPIVAAPGEIGYLEKLGERLLAHMPPTEIKFRFHLIDIPQANAFVVPGGRVYVSRKIIAFVRSEDELAGILGHEFGHVLARQGSRRMTRVMKDAMGVNAIGDRADVFAQYNRLLDGVAKKRVRGAKYVDEEVGPINSPFTRWRGRAMTRRR